MKVALKVLFLGLVVVSLSSCDSHNDTPNAPLLLVGSGSYTYTAYQPFVNKPIACFYHVPTKSTTTTPILIVLPGASRDAEAQRNNLVNKANSKGFIILALEFPETNFSGSDAYNLANIFEDGDNPSPSTLNPEEEWTFSVIDSIFADFKVQSGNTMAAYDIVGFSAGAQLLHRFLIFEPHALFNRVVIASAGWYNMPTDTIDFPYGLGKSPRAGANLSPVFERRAYVIVGENDTDPNSANLRHTPEADEQGNNRVQRAQYFYQVSREIAINQALSFRWSYQSVPNTANDGGDMLNFAAGFLY